jgi:16S rRNA (uracil1498-N3)-methyltransferase
MGDAALAADVKTMARFFVPKKNLRDTRAVIDGEELAHLKRVLRLVPGDRITIFDGSGWEHEAVIRELSADRGDVEIIRSYEAGRESRLQVTLAIGLTKGEKMDFVIEKATELGVQTIVPFSSAFSVPKWDARKIAARTIRWQKIALSAAKQCGRTRVPEILPLREFRALVEGDSAALKLLFWENERHQSLRRAHEKFSQAESVLIMIGPEGGFDSREAELAQSHDFQPVCLGKRILRAETAAVTALSLVQFLWGDLA